MLSYKPITIIASDLKQFLEEHTTSNCMINILGPELKPLEITDQDIIVSFHIGLDGFRGRRRYVCGISANLSQFNYSSIYNLDNEKEYQAFIRKIGLNILSKLQANWLRLIIKDY